ncbi:MAG: tripartite tricarboxylate transporter permease [Armatimonadota bacterium]|nr:tripartite tricarboxylate transporter permease [Armatimonadota bacterium]
MNFLENLLAGFSAAVAGPGIPVMIAGVAWGTIGGAIPGISGAVAMSLALPYTLSLDAATALVMLAGVWAGANYGGSIPAILMRMPGTPGAAAALFDGYELKRQGLAAKALGVSLVCGTIGGLISVVVLIALVVPLGNVVLAFGSPEVFALALFGLTLLAGLTERSFLKGLASGYFGLLLTTVGIDTLTGSLRFTFGRSELLSGLDIVSVMVGLFAVSEMLVQIAHPSRREAVPEGNAYTAFPTLAELRSVWRATVVGTVVGLIVGIMPGAGATASSFVAYNEARRWSKRPDLFGKGSMEGVAAPETANNAVQGGDLVPTLALGIPGSNSAAIMLAALILHGIVPGPFLLNKHTHLVFTLFAGLILVNLLMIPVGLVILRGCLLVLRLDRPVLIAAILAMIVIGTYAADLFLLNPLLALFFGVVGYGMRRYGFSPAAAVLGLVLGFLVESELRRSLLISYGSWTIFVVRPISAVLLALTLGAVLYPAVMYLRSRQHAQAAGAGLS